MIDSEVRRLLLDAHERAIAILTRDRDYLEAIAQKLLEKEVMDRNELRELLGLDPDVRDGPEVGHVPDQAAD